MGTGAKGTELEGRKAMREEKKSQRRERLKEEQRGEKGLPKEGRTEEEGKRGRGGGEA